MVGKFEVTDTFQLVQPLTHLTERVGSTDPLISELPVQVFEVGRLVLVEVDQVIRQLLDRGEVVDVDERLRRCPLGVPRNI